MLGDNPRTPVRISSLPTLFNCSLKFMLESIYSSGTNIYAEKGTEFHKLCADFHRGVAVSPSRFADVQKLFDNYKTLEAKYNRGVLEVEKHVSFEHNGVHFAGTLDQLCRCQYGKYTLVDLKTGKAPKKYLNTWYIPQLCGYFYGVYKTYGIIPDYVRIYQVESLNTSDVSDLVPSDYLLSVNLGMESVLKILDSASRIIRGLWTEEPIYYPNNACENCNWKPFNNCIKEVENVGHIFRTSLPCLPSSANEGLRKSD